MLATPGNVRGLYLGNVLRECSSGMFFGNVLRRFFGGRWRGKKPASDTQGHPAKSQTQTAFVVSYRTQHVGGFMFNSSSSLARCRGFINSSSSFMFNSSSSYMNVAPPRELLRQPAAAPLYHQEKSPRRSPRARYRQSSARRRLESRMRRASSATSTACS